MQSPSLAPQESGKLDSKTSAEIRDPKIERGNGMAVSEFSVNP